MASKILSLLLAGLSLKPSKLKTKLCKSVNRIYLGSRSGGFWKTIDGGNTWVNTTDFLFAAGVNTIAVSPENPNHVLINVRNSNNGVTHGIYKSTDAGETWSITNFNPDNLSWGGLGTYNSIYKINNIILTP